MKNPIAGLRALIDAELADVYTTLPGEVVSYDGVTVTARPALAKRLANGEVLKPPQIVRVPVRWFCGWPIPPIPPLFPARPTTRLPTSTSWIPRWPCLTNLASR